MNDTEPRWFAVNTQPGKEEMALRHLLAQNYQVFLPRQEKTVRHARRLTTRPVAFFPGYLFVAFDPLTTRWRSIEGTWGVRGLVRTRDQPLPLPQGLIEALRGWSNAQGIITPRHNFNPGDEVRVVAGPFLDLLGEITELSGRDRIKVLLELAEGHLTVVLPRHTLLPITHRSGLSLRPGGRRG